MAYGYLYTVKKYKFNLIMRNMFLKYVFILLKKKKSLKYCHPLKLIAMEQIPCLSAIAAWKWQSIVSR